MFQLLYIFLAASTVSAGYIQPRAPLGVAAIVKELSHLEGRDFCFAYISAEAYALPRYSTETVTTTTFKTTTTRATTTSEETIGTLRKGTTTHYGPESTTTTSISTEYAASTETLTTTIREGTITSTKTKTVTTEYASVGPYPPLNPLRRRQDEYPPDDVPPTPSAEQTPPVSTQTFPTGYTSAWGTAIPPPADWTPEPEAPVETSTEEPPRPTPSMALPAVLLDSNPSSISAACTKVLSKYPIYNTVDEVTTNWETTSSTITTTSSITKTKKVTEINPYTTKTMPGSTITQTITSFYDVPTVTVVETIVEPHLATTTATVTVGKCDWAALPTPSMIGGVLPVRNTFEDAFHVLSLELTQSDCCKACEELKYRGGGCLGTYWIGHVFDNPNYAGSCQITWRETMNGDTCPVKRIGVYWNDENEWGRPSAWRPGPCLAQSGGLFECDINDPNICFQRWADQLGNNP